MKKVFGSFRDPSGYVYVDGNRVYRTINKIYQSQWESMENSGFLDNLIQKNKLCEFYVVPPGETPECLKDEDLWKVITVKRIPFISYPYEWAFDQLKDAALLTLDIQK